MNRVTASINPSPGRDVRRVVVQRFLWSVAILLAFTAMAKLWSATGSAKMLLMTDPLLGLHFNVLLIATALVELAIAAVCVFSRSHLIALLSVVWLGSMFLLYRMGLHLTDWRQPCPCLGNLPDALRVSPAIADAVMKIIMLYFLVGGLTAITWSFRTSPINGSGNNLATTR